MINNFKAALAAEHIKKSGTGIYVVAAIVGAFSPIARLIVKIFAEKDERAAALPVNYFQEYLTDCLMVFAPFFFPLVIIITVSRITQLDHKNGGWQLMETQPLQKFSIYFSKFLVVLIANLITILSLVGTALVCAGIGLLMEDSSKLDTSFPVVYSVHLISRLFVASLFITALQFFIAVLMPSFIWSMLIGFFLFMLTGILKAFDYIPDWYPYEILNKINAFRDGSDLGYWFTYTEYISLFAALLLLFIGFHWFKFKRFKAAFIGSSNRFLTVLASVVILGGIILYILKPKVMAPYTKTVIAGKVESDVPIRQILLFDNLIRDTVAKIVVVDGKFHYEAKSNLVLDKYEVEFDHSFKQKIVVGNNDSVFLDVKFYNNTPKLTITGTRLAENQPSKQSMLSGFSRIEWYLEDNSYIEKPNSFAKALYKEWKDRTKDKSSSKTVDNYVPRPDFLAIDQKLITIKYLNYWEKFLEKRNGLATNEKTPDPKEIGILRKQLSLTDESLLSQNSYFEYVQQQLIKKDTSDIDFNTKQIAAISKLKKGSFKDKMMFWQLNESIQIADANEESKQLIVDNAEYFTNQKYVHTLNKRFSSLYSLRKGMAAPIFNAVTLKGKPFSLSELKGKLTIIDVWATWCAPCAYQSPYFESLAIKYKSKPIQFVALSVDKNKESWFIKAKTKSKSVLQLHANDMMKFFSDYSAETIPRFILIDENGNFINSKMPFPSEKTFEILLKKALKLADD